MNSSNKYQVWVNVYRFVGGKQLAGRGGKTCINVDSLKAGEDMLKALKVMARLQGWTRDEANPDTFRMAGCIIDRYNEGSFTVAEREMANIMR